MISEGSAFLDRSGRVIVADAGFRMLLGLPGGDASDALQGRLGADPALAALLSGEGPASVRLAASDSAPACDLRRVQSDAGLLLRASATDPVLAAPAIEYAMQGIALMRLAASLAHEVKNPLNAMALQLALLTDKIGTTSEELASACAGNLGSLKNQIHRIDEVMRRYLEVADPGPSGGFDAGSLLADVTNLFGHEARRRRIALVPCEAAPGTVRAAGDPGRVARLLLGLLWRAVTGTLEGGRLASRAAVTVPGAVLTVEYTRGSSDPAAAWMGDVIEAAVPELGARLEESSEGDTVMVALVLPKERPL